MSYRTPVTILTGFLGSGKTTLLNRILTERHGLRIAVIENEFGEIGIDHELVINAEEEIFEMNNGCICCTVRGDLIRIMGNLAKRRDKFDHVIIETTGIADPGPVVQTSFVDTDIKESFSLDAVITLVDAKHVLQHIDESTEAKEQIAFADILLLNKSDLLTPAELDRLEARIKSITESRRFIERSTLSLRSPESSTSVVLTWNGRSAWTRSSWSRSILSSGADCIFCRLLRPVLSPAKIRIRR